MTGQLPPLPRPPSRRDDADPLDDVTLQRDSARALAAILEERNEKALRLHTKCPTGWGCDGCHDAFPCRTRRALTGADEDDR